MTSKIEKSFFEYFGIEPYEFDGVYYHHIEYPKITPEKLLEMICVLNKHYAENFQCATMLVGDTIEKIKECVLKDCIEQSQRIKSEIQQLFKDYQKQWLETEEENGIGERSINEKT